MRVGTGSGAAPRRSPRPWRRVWLTALVVLLTTVATFILAPTTALAATVENVPYLDAAGHPQVVDDATLLDSSAAITDLGGILHSGWYLVRGDFNHSGTITVSGAVHLILEDGSSLTVTGSPNRAGISVNSGNSVAVYAQSTGATMGQLTATGGSGGTTIGAQGAGIGGDARTAGGTITVNGGDISATGGFNAAGIGGGFNAAGGTTTINGGTITAAGGGSGAGIGGGSAGAGGTITINGGAVTATGSGSGNGAGIGGGTGGAGGVITINGGTVTATGLALSAGIGGGFAAAGGTIVIGGGTVTATGSNGSAGIGGGGPSSVASGSASGDITITGAAAVRATGGGGAPNPAGGGAGIGSGGGFSTHPAGAVGTIIINTTGTVTALGGVGNPGHGNGADIGFGGSINGNGQEVPPDTTVTVHTVTITQSAGGTIRALPSRATGSVPVPHGANQTFAITPDAGFAIASVTVDGTNVGAVDSWTIPNITTAGHTITAAFARLLPSLTIAKHAEGAFVQGGKGEYTITVGNAGTGNTDGTAVTVRDSLPAGLQAVNLSGQGWECSLASLTCTRSDMLDDEGSFPAITLTVQVSCEASGTVTNSATVTGGGDPATHKASAHTVIEPSAQCAPTTPPATCTSPPSTPPSSPPTTPTTTPTTTPSTSAPCPSFVPGPGLTGGSRPPKPPLAPILAAVLIALVGAAGLSGWRLRRAGAPRHHD